MEPRGPGRNGSTATASVLPPLRRRLSMEEDLFYHQIMTTHPRRPSQPPPYEEAPDRRRPSTAPGLAPDGVEGNEKLPDYSCSLHLEGVFSKKMEIEKTTKRAEDRRWHTAYVILHGTALNIYFIKKDWGWGKSRGGPTVSPDNPPWVKRAKLDKAYSLLHADVGIAADYRKRRYVIRVRAEEDQFLLSCVELSTFVKWLDVLFAAIDVAAPIDDRDFPRDQSIPRIQRLRWFRGQSPARMGTFLASSSRQLDAPQATTPVSTEPPTAGQTIPEYSASEGEEDDSGDESDENDDDDDDNDDNDGQPGPSRMDPISRLSTTSYPNEAIDYLTGKWAPDHQWSSAHDMLYAKLCYSVLLFKSPRKSNYIISRGKQWLVDWATGRMACVQPPGYGDLELFGPWQVIHTENRRI